METQETRTMTQLHAEPRLDEHDPAPAPVAAPQAPPAAPPAAASNQESNVHQKNPLLAGFFSLFPGMGNVYNGLYLRGLTFFLIIAGIIGILAETNASPIFGLGLAFFWIFNILDAYRQATLINYGYAQDLGFRDLPQAPGAAQGGIAGGIILVVIGTIAVLEEYFRIDLEWLLQLWPFVLVGVGLWMIYASIKKKREMRRTDL
jgi:hypothetical protein